MLLNRSTRRVILAADGAAYYDRAVRVLDEIESSMSHDKASPTPASSIRIPARTSSSCATSITSIDADQRGILPVTEVQLQNRAPRESGAARAVGDCVDDDGWPTTQRFRRRAGERVRGAGGDRRSRRVRGRCQGRRGHRDRGDPRGSRDRALARRVSVRLAACRHRQTNTKASLRNIASSPKLLAMR